MRTYLLCVECVALGAHEGGLQRSSLLEQEGDELGGEVGAPELEAEEAPIKGLDLLVGSVEGTLEGLVLVLKARGEEKLVGANH